MRKDMNSALRASLRAEETATDNRFDRADALLAARSLDTDQALQKTVKSVTPPKVLAEHDKVMRDSFTMPNLEYDRIGQIRDRCLKSGVSANKSEVLRAGLAVLAGMNDEDLVHVVRSLPKVKTGRPVQAQ